MRSVMSRGVVAVIALTAVLALGACRDTGKGALYEVSGRLFEFNYRLARATYVVTLNPLRPAQEGNVAVVDFENPAGGAPLVVEQKIWPKLPHVTLTSPPLTCVVKDRPYKVTIRIEGPDGATRQTIETEMASTEDQSILPDLPLVVGDGYMPNPALAGNRGGKLPNRREPPCPAAAPADG